MPLLLLLLILLLLLLLVIGLPPTRYRRTHARTNTRLPRFTSLTFTMVIKHLMRVSKHASHDGDGCAVVLVVGKHQSR